MFGNYLLNATSYFIFYQKKMYNIVVVCTKINFQCLLSTKNKELITSSVKIRFDIKKTAIVTVTFYRVACTGIFLMISFLSWISFTILFASISFSNIDLRYVIQQKLLFSLTAIIFWQFFGWSSALSSTVQIEMKTCRLSIEDIHWYIALFSCTLFFCTPTTSSKAETIKAF